MPASALTARRILGFWLPLAGTWLMMAIEGPFLAAVIARLSDPVENLAAYGMAFAFAVIVESPVIMLMSASTALVRDADSLRAMRRFTLVLNVVLTGVHLGVVMPPVFAWLAASLLDFSDAVTRLTHLSLVLLLPWPAAIGYRRFHQGLLIRRGFTRWVAYGTLVRLLAMSLTALVGALGTSMSGAFVGAIALSVGVVAEAVVAGRMSARVVRELAAVSGDPRETRLGARQILGFYTPLALTSVLAMGVQPMVTFFMSQSRLALESLAVLPVIGGLTFVFRSLGVSYQEVGIALLAERTDHYPRLRDFALVLAGATSIGLGLIAFTPLAVVWLHGVSGLSLELTEFARAPLRILVILPGLSVFLSFQRAALVSVRRTTPITWATAVEVSAIAGILVTAIQRFDLVGAVAAALALSLGRVAGNLWLLLPWRRAVRRLRAHSEHLPGERALGQRR